MNIKKTEKMLEMFTVLGFSGVSKRKSAKKNREIAVLNF